MEDNRLPCHETCLETRDINNKCDGSCLSGTPDYEQRLEQARIYNEK